MNSPAPGTTHRRLDQAIMRAARQQAASSGQPLLKVLEDQLQLTPDDFVETLCNAFGYPSISASEMHACEPAFDLLPHTEASRRECILLRDTSGTLLCVLANPFSEGLRSWVEEHIAFNFSWRIAHLTDIHAFLVRHEDSLRAMEAMAGAGTETEDAANAGEELSLRSISEHSSPVVKLVHSTLYDALKIGASDIHMETGPAGLSIKYRIDGVLSVAGSAAGAEFAEQVISRIKVMAELDIAERRIPQDGRFKVMANGREVDFRVSIMPSIFGEDAVLRILDKRALADQITGLRLDQLGLDASTIAAIRRMSNEPYGMVLVTGPTGSGKTTTLYAALTEINRGEDKIVTIEDPVEYQLPGVLQIPVNEKKGLTFARGLRSILRHDPDRIMVGEIRDEETAQIAVQAALTGHLVFTTVHANSVLDVINRFLHMGVIPQSFVSALNGIVAQRLVRVICPNCAKDEVPDEQVLNESGLSKEATREFRFRIGQGCGQCRGSGYKGRRALAEILRLNDEIRTAILRQESTDRIREAARRNGTRFMRDAALELVRNGETTLQEINRVTFVE